jgi:hypothetical protein
VGKDAALHRNLKGGADLLDEAQQRSDGPDAVGYGIDADDGVAA